MDSRAKSAVLWGTVGAFAFLVLQLGYRWLIGPLPLGAVGTLLAALAVAAVVAVASYLTENRLTRKGRV